MNNRSYCTRSSSLSLLLVCWLLAPAGRVTAIFCASCEDNVNCRNQKCQGDYCLAMRVEPRIGANLESKSIFIQGCLKNGAKSGALLRKGVADSCASFDVGDGLADATFCTCASKSFCNRNPEKLPVEQIDLTKCLCDGNHCDGVSECEGQYCTHVTRPDGTVERGCLNEPTPLLIGAKGAACMLPPMLGSMHYSGGESIDDIRQTLACICKGTDYCNDEKPKQSELHPETETCETGMKLKTPVLTVSTPTSKKCNGQYCYRVGQTIHKSISPDFQSSDSEGCITFSKDTELDADFNPTGSMQMSSPQFTFRLRYTSDESPLRAQRRKPDRQPVQDEPPKQAEGDDDAAPNYVDMRDTPPPPLEVEEGNTLLVGVFVVLMLCIVVAGVVWKFELHKKIFRARYETVAGG